MNAPFILLMGGGTASGKTTLARALAARHGALHLPHDRYYLDVPDPRRHNYDHPDALDTALLVQNLGELRAGRPAELPIYHFATHRRISQTERVEPAPLIIVEGILVLHDPGLREAASFRVYVHTADDLRLARRISRDAVERGREVPDVLRQYLGTVRPMHQTFVAPSRQWADLVVSGEVPIDEMVAEVEATLRAVGAPLST